MERFRLDVVVEDLVLRILYEHVDSMTLEDHITKALKNAKSYG